LPHIKKVSEAESNISQLDDNDGTPNKKQKEKQSLTQIKVPSDKEVRQQLRPQVSNHIKQTSFSSVVPYDILKVSRQGSEVNSQKGQDSQSITKLDASPRFIKREVFLENPIIEFLKIC